MDIDSEQVKRRISVNEDIEQIGAQKRRKSSLIEEVKYQGEINESNRKSQEQNKPIFNQAVKEAVQVGQQKAMKSNMNNEIHQIADTKSHKIELGAEIKSKEAKNQVLGDIKLIGETKNLKKDLVQEIDQRGRKSSINQEIEQIGQSKTLKENLNSEIRKNSRD